jgi:hypothetical protein
MRSYAESTFLPFSLRLFNTVLPLAVLILFLKPCSLLLCLFLGWYVLNTVNTPVPYCRKTTTHSPYKFFLIFII